MDPSAIGKNLRIEDIINKYNKKSSKKDKGKKLTSQPVIESSAAETSSYSMTATSDPTASKNLQNQLTKFMQNDYNVSTSNASASAIGGHAPKGGAWREGGQVSAVKESDDSSDDDEDYSQSITVTGSGPTAQKERFEQLRQKYMNL